MNFLNVLKAPEIDEVWSMFFGAKEKDYLSVIKEVFLFKTDDKVIHISSIYAS